MAPLVSQIDSNKLRRDIQNEVALIFAKFGKDLFNISKVTGRNTVAPFWPIPVLRRDVLTSYKSLVHRVREKTAPLNKML